MKPETAFSSSIHDHLPPKRKFYRLKNQHQFTSGVADQWYSGRKNDLWVEYKWVNLLKTNNMVDLSITELQLDWLNCRYEEQRRVAVIVGFDIRQFKHGVVMVRRSWAANQCMRDTLIHHAARPKDIALWLMDQCLGGSYKHSVRPIVA